MIATIIFMALRSPANELSQSYVFGAPRPSGGGGKGPPAPAHASRRRGRGGVLPEGGGPGGVRPNGDFLTGGVPSPRGVGGLRPPAGQSPPPCGGGMPATTRRAWPIRLETKGVA